MSRRIIQPTTSPRSAGFTLMELVVVLMIFALVAVLGLQALTGSLRARDRIGEADRATSELTFALSLLRSDLEAAVPLLFYPPGGGIESAFRIAPGQDEFAISVSPAIRDPGETVAPPGRVIWSIDRNAGKIYRQTWPVLIPASPALAAPKVEIGTGFTDLAIRTMTPARLWVAGADPDLLGTAAALPLAIEIVIDSARFGPLPTLVAYP